MTPYETQNAKARRAAPDPANPFLVTTEVEKDGFTMQVNLADAQNYANDGWTLPTKAADRLAGGLGSPVGDEVYSFGNLDVIGATVTSPTSIRPRRGVVG